MQQPSHLSMRGVVDLAAVKAAADAAAEAAKRGDSGGPGAAIVVTEANFEQDVLVRSRTVPVVVEFRAGRSEQSKVLGPVLERLAAAAGGAWVLGRVDADVSPALTRAFGVQAVPSVVAVLGEQPVPLFSGVPAESQVATAIDRLIAAAPQLIPGYTGAPAPAEGAETDAAEPPAGPVDPLEAQFDAAYRAIESGDLDAAADAYKRVLADRPADRDAQAGLAQVELLRRVQNVDPAAALRAADTAPADAAAQLLAADLEILGGHVDEAFNRLIETVRRTSGDDREHARVRLLELFEVVGTDDPRVARARTRLASVLF